MARGNAGHLELMRDRSRDFPSVPDAGTYSSARVWHCNYRTLAPLAAFVNLATLDIATFPDPTLEPIEGLVRLESLSIVHLPRVSDLAPLRHLQALRHLSLATLPSWDASGKVSQVDSLAPLAELPALMTLELFGVRPPDGRVDHLVRSTSLREVWISQYPPAEIDRLNQEMARRAMEGG